MSDHPSPSQAEAIAYAIARLKIILGSAAVVPALDKTISHDASMALAMLEQAQHPRSASVTVPLDDLLTILRYVQHSDDLNDATTGALDRLGDLTLAVRQRAFLDAERQTDQTKTQTQTTEG